MRVMFPAISVFLAALILTGCLEGIGSGYNDLTEGITKTVIENSKECYESS